MSRFRLLFGSTTAIRRARPTWLLVAATRTCVVPVFDHADNFRAVGEPKAARPAHEPYKWINLIKPT